MDLPTGLTITDVRAIVELYHKFLTEIENGEILRLHEHEWYDVYDGRPHGDYYVDRYLIINNVEYCVTTCYEEDDYETTFLCEYVTVMVPGGENEDVYFTDLEQILVEYEVGSKEFFDPFTERTILVDWDFIMKYYPGYDHSDTIAWEDDLECALSGDCDDEKLARIKRDWGETREDWENAHYELYSEIVRDAIRNYKTINNIR